MKSGFKGDNITVLKDSDLSDYQTALLATDR